MQHNLNRVFGLDLMRATAIGFVVFAHGALLLYPQFPRLSYFGHLGGLGVEVFFVLSGFLIGSILIEYGQRLRNRSDLLHFMGRRWFRTLPNYYLYFCINLLVAKFLFQSPLPDMVEILQFLTFTQSLAWSPVPFFLESWSLAVEEWFYLLTPIMISILLRAKMDFDRALILTAAVLIGVSFLARMLHLDRPYTWATEYRMITLYRLDALMFGILAALLRMRFQWGWNVVRWPFAILGIIGFCLLYDMMLSMDRESSTFAKIGLLDSFDLCFALMLPLLSSLKTSGLGSIDYAVRKIALWSYSMYLCNLLIANLMMRFLGTPNTGQLGLSLALFVLFNCLVVLVSALTYRYFEVPILSFRDRWLPRSTR